MKIKEMNTFFLTSNFFPITSLIFNRDKCFQLKNGKNTIGKTGSSATYIPPASTQIKDKLGDIDELVSDFSNCTLYFTKTCL